MNYEDNYSMENPSELKWRLHLKSPPEKVYEFISTDEGRMKFWAESSKTNGNVIFLLESDGKGGTDLTVVDYRSTDKPRMETLAGWVSLLLTLKAAVDFNVDLRNHDTKRTWDNGYVDN